ncbi:MAG: hypothetical protein ACYCU7_01330 [Acidimicrobiales bacterium]
MGERSGHRHEGAAEHRLGAGAGAPGLRRVSWVRIEVVAGRPVRAEAVGVAHRLPVTVPISLKRAAELAAGGVPVVRRRVDAETA